MTSNAKRMALPLGFSLLHALIAIISISHPAFFGVIGTIALTGHHDIFDGYASRAMLGQVPYRDFLVEYPILSFPVMLAPRVFTTTLEGYEAGMVAMLLMFNATTVYLVAGRVERDEKLDEVFDRLFWYTLDFAALCPLLMGPFDLAPTCLAFASACWWSSARPVRGGMMAGLGALMKIFPGLVAIPSVVLELSRLRETKGRGLLAFTLTSAAGLAIWFAIGGRGVLDSFRYHSERGLEAGSTWAGLVYLYAALTGQVVTSTYDHASLHITADWGSILPSLALPIQLAILALVAWRFHRSGMGEPLRYSAAAILGFIVGGKVLSPQFMIWLMPFVAALGGPIGPRVRRVFLVCCVMSSMIFPWGVLIFQVHGYRWAVLFLNVRNGLLVYLLVLLLFGPKAENGTNQGET